MIKYFTIIYLELLKYLDLLEEKQEIKSTMNYTLQAQNQVFYMVFVKSTKVVLDGVPPFCTILSAIGTPTYKLPKFLVPVLETLTYNHQIFIFVLWKT